MQQAGPLRRALQQQAARAAAGLWRRALSSSSSSSSSVSEEEVKKFGAYGQGWWDDEGEGGLLQRRRRGRARSGAGPLHALNPVRVRYIAEAITGSSSSSTSSRGVRKGGGQGLLSGYRILDVGCGGGLLSEALARLGAEVTGLDPAVANIDVARRHAAADPLTRAIRYEAATVEEFIAAGPENRRFHAVVSSEVIEHVASPPEFMQALAGAVISAAQGEGEPGRVILTTINRTPKAYLIAILGAEHLTGVVPVGTHDWAKFLQPQELARFGKAAGLKVRDVSGLVYNPLTGVWRLDKEDTDVNYAMHLVKSG